MAAVEGCGVGVSGAAGVQQLVWLAAASNETTRQESDTPSLLRQRLTLDKVGQQMGCLTVDHVDHVDRG